MERAGRPARGDDGGAGGGRSRWEPDFVLRWGSRKRLRCAETGAGGEAAGKNAARLGGRRRRVVGAGKDPRSLLLHRAPPLRVLRNSKACTIMTSQQQQLGNGGSWDHENTENGHSMLSDVATMANGGRAGWPPGGEVAEWPKFAITLTAREKEEDFLVFKGTKLPLRPKKRAKLIQRTVNLVCPGSWLCDLTQERYEVREKQASKKKKTRGLKAMESVESNSEQEQQQ